MPSDAREVRSNSVVTIEFRREWRNASSTSSADLRKLTATLNNLLVEHSLSSSGAFLYERRLARGRVVALMWRFDSNAREATGEAHLLDSNTDPFGCIREFGNAAVILAHRSGFDDVDMVIP